MATRRRAAATEPNTRTQPESFVDLIDRIYMASSETTAKIQVLRTGISGVRITDQPNNIRAGLTFAQNAILHEVDESNAARTTQTRQKASFDFTLAEIQSNEHIMLRSLVALAKNNRRR